MQAHRTSFRYSITSTLSGFILVGMLALTVFANSVVMAADTVPKSTIVRVTPGGFSPVPVIIGMTNNGTTFDVTWFGLTPPYTLEMSTNLNDDTWTAAAPGTNGNTITIENNALSAFLRVNATAPNYVGAATCSGCHRGTHTLWNETRHASAFETLKNIGQDKNGYCVQCHVVGYGLPNGFVDEETTPGLAGVQCENCHGPAGNHASDPFNLAIRPKLEMSAKVCGGCHSGAHHNNYVEWEQSKHGHAVNTIKNLPFDSPSCLECHSQDYRFALENNLTPPTVAEAQLSLECATCHTAHGPNVEVAQLKKPIGMLCGECHTAGEPALGSSPHHPQFQVLSGYGTFNDDGTLLTNRWSTHSALANDGGTACTQCHVIQIDVENPNEGNPKITGHTFNPFDESIPSHSPDQQYTGCVPCHSSNDADFLKSFKQGNVNGYLTWLSPFFDSSSPSYIDPTGLNVANSNRLAVAKWNYQFLAADSSGGIHNPNFYRASLIVSSNIVVDLGTTPPLQSIAGAR